MQPKRNKIHVVDLFVQPLGILDATIKDDILNLDPENAMET